jgi:tetratricopeptide (TPR) repeat protein
VQLARQVDRVCDEFEDAWAADVRPRPEDFLGRAPEPARAALVRELILVEVAYRRRRGEDCRAEEYAGRFPELDTGWLAAALAPPAPGPGSDAPTRRQSPHTLAAPAGSASRAGGRAFGDYELLRELGRGGMGVVYQAWQTSLSRMVALKMILAGAHAGPEELARFRAEAEAVARLQHPNIVQIHEVGEQDGRPYFALEYVEGGSLHEKLASTPQPAREAAGLAETLARAVQYAHQRGIVHRDLKPANILLSFSRDPQESASAAPPCGSRLNEAVPKITDFGLAKVLVGARVDPTQTGAVLGTPGYMAPEQASGRPRDVGPAADVYALGAILYEMLTGRPPFLGQTPLDTLEQVRTNDPIPPRQLQPKVPRDLETICLKCLPKEPEKRYASAQELADDLRRFLAGESIRARPVGRAGLLARWCRRKPAVAGLLATLAVVLAGGVITVVGLWLRAERLRARADTNYREAQDNFQLALGAVEQYCTRVAEDKRLKEKDLRPLRQQLLQTAVDFHEEFVARHGDDPGLRAQLGRAYLRLGRLTTEIDARPRAIDCYEQGAALFEGLSRDDPGNADYRRGLAAARLGLGALYDQTGRPADGEAALRDAVRLGEGLVAGDADSAADQAALAEALTQLGFLYQRNGRAKESAGPVTRSIELSEGLVKRFPTVVSYRVALVRSRAALGDLYRLHSGPRRWPDAEKEYLACLDVQKELMDLEPKNPEHRATLASLHRILGHIYYVSRRPQQAVQSHKDGIAIMEPLVQRHGSVASYRMVLAELYDGLGNVYHIQRRTTRAEAPWEAPWQEALRLRRLLVDEDPADADYLCVLALSQCHVGFAEQTRGRDAEAVDQFSQAIATLGKVRGPNPQSSRATEILAIALENRARAQGRLGRHAEALQDWDRVLELNPNPVLRPMERLERTLALARTGDHARATADAEELLHFAADGHFAAIVYSTAATVHAVAARAAAADAALPGSERAARAERYAARAVELLRKAAGAGHDLSAAKDDRDFDFLRARDDFKKLLASADEQAKPPGP